jgi:hypothetical protein
MRSFLSWLAQQIVAPLPQVVSFLLVALFAYAIAPGIAQFGHLLLWAAPLGWFLSFMLAIGIRCLFPGASSAGRWIWVLPVALLVLGFCCNAAAGSFRSAVLIFFTTGPRGLDVFVLMTCPTLSAVVYSLGMIWSARRQALKASPTRNSGPGDASGVTVSSSP